MPACISGLAALHALAHVLRRSALDAQPLTSLPSPTCRLRTLQHYITLQALPCFCFRHLPPCAQATCCSASRRSGLSAAMLEAAIGSVPPQFFASRPSVRFSRLPMSFASAALTCSDLTKSPVSAVLEHRRRPERTAQQATDAMWPTSTKLHGKLSFGVAASPTRGRALWLRLCDHS